MEGSLGKSKLVLLISFFLLVCIFPAASAPPTVSDDYDSLYWQNSTQDIEITCTDDGSCVEIDWEIRNETNWNLLDQGSQTGASISTMTVSVGDSNQGELTLNYRATDNNGEYSKWGNQTVKIDKQDPTMSVEIEDTGNWFKKKIEVNTSANDNGPSGLGLLDIVFVVDTSGSFKNDWQSFENNIEQIEDDIENDSETDARIKIWGINNTAKNHSDNRACMAGQKLTSPLGCYENYRVMDDVTDLTAYMNWLGTSYQAYDPFNPPPDSGGAEDPPEGWGQALLDIVAKDDFRENTTKVAVAVGDSDTNGAWECGDSNSFDLAQYLGDTVLPDNNITAFSLRAGNCGSNVTGQQMTEIGPVVQYSSASTLGSKIKSQVGDIEPEKLCDYRVKPEGSSWSAWKDRPCPAGNFSLDVGFGKECNVNGYNACKVQFRVQDNAGNVDLVEKDFDINMSDCSLESSYQDVNGSYDGGRLRNDAEFCGRTPGAENWRDQDVGHIDNDGVQETCRDNNYWVSRSEVENHPFAFNEGIDDDWFFHHKNLSDNGLFTANISDPDDTSWASDETPVPTGIGGGFNKVATKGFCAGDDEGEHLITQECRSGLCSSNLSTVAVANSPNKCVLSPSVDGFSGSERRIYSPGEQVNINVAGDINSMSCYGGQWFDDWPVQTYSSNFDTEVGSDTTISFEIVNPKRTPTVFELSIEGDLAKHTAFANQNDKEIRVEPQSSETVDLRFSSVRTFSSKSLSLQATSTDASLTGEKEVFITSSRNTGGSNNTAVSVPGITFINILVLFMISSVFYIALD